VKNPGFDKIDRRHPIVRFLALDDVNIAAARKLVPKQGDKVVGASDGGASPILIAGTRGVAKFVALGFDVAASDWPLRPAWPLFVVDCINWFTDEDVDVLAGYRTGEVWRVPVGEASARASVKLPDGSIQAVAVHEGRAVFVGQHSGFYEVSANSNVASGVSVTLAGNLLDASESAIAPHDRLLVDGTEAGELAALHPGVRRELWMYFLLAAALVIALEWATYHRRVTV
jgi:hypothetical protein